MKDIAVALDWTPNTNHAGFYVAKAKGFYADAGLNVALLSPHLDEYKDTPASKLTSGKAQFAVTPSETVISFHTNTAEEKPKIVAVATLLQDSTSAIVTLKSSGIDKPAQLDGKRYASYAARFEGRIVQQMIRNDGGKGDYIELVPPMLGIWNTLLTGDADATWIFSAWEGIQAKRKGIELNSFKLEDYNIAYGYSPVLITLPSTLSDDADMVKAFLAATSKGYKFAVENPKAAAELLVKQVAEDTASCPLPQPLELDMCVESQVGRRAWIPTASMLLLDTLCAATGLPHCLPALRTHPLP